jgi:ADP-ribose pyrophosphatase YjhB (NUDIX family)
MSSLRQLNEQKYCGWCGGSITYTSAWGSKCEQCNYRNYHTPNPCTQTLVVRSNGDVLIAKRSIEPHHGKYAIPGGFMEIGDETIEAAALRELAEETNIIDSDIQRLSYFGSAVGSYPWDGVDVRNIVAYFVCQLQPDISDINLDASENSSHLWISAKSLDTVDFGWDTDKAVLEKYFLAEGGENESTQI